MTSRLLKTLVLIAVAALVAGCKLAVIVNEGGVVQSSSGTHDCAEGTICTIEITSPTFSESFTAVAKPGYQFIKWQDGNGFICAGSTNPACTLAMSGNRVEAAAVATFEKVYAMPVFKFVGIDTDGDGVKDHVDTDDDNDGVLDVDDACPFAGPNYDGFGCPGTPITDTVTVDGKVWAQTDLFLGVTWSHVAAVCPAGICTGILNGHSVTGWTFASVDDVNDLFNYYFGYPQMGPGPDESIGGSTAAHQMIDDGFRGIVFNEHWDIYSYDVNAVEGFTRDLSPDGRPFYGSWRVQVQPASHGSAVAFTNKPHAYWSDNGAWLFRTPD